MRLGFSSLLAPPWRRLRREPTTALLIVFILALATGAAALIFTLVDALLLDPLPFGEADRLVRLEAVQNGVGGKLSMRELTDIRERTDLFVDVAAYKPPSGGYTMGGDGAPHQASAALVTHNLFAVLGVVPAIGSSFPASYDLERSFGVVLNDRLFKQQMADDPSRLAETLTLDGAPNYKIFGVMPPGFDFPVRSDIYRSIFINENNPNLEDRAARNVLGVARLKAATTRAKARERLEILSQRLAAEHPDTNRAVKLRLVPLEEAYAGDYTAYLWILGLGVSLLLAIGCVNAANLLLARSLVRQAELALEAALGASRARLAWRILSEGMILTTVGVVLGLALAHAALGSLRALVRFDLPSWVRLEMDVSTLVFLALLTLTTALAAGLLPASRLSRIEASEALRAGARGSLGGGRRTLSRWLVVTQVTLAFVLLVGTAVSVGGFRELSRSELGFRPQGLLSFKVNLPWFLYSRRNPEKLDLFHRRVIEDLEALPAVESVALTTDLPFTEGADADLSPFVTEGQDPADIDAHTRLRHSAISPTLFATLGIPILEGRGFDSGDHATTRPVAVISRRAARRLFPGQSALGERVRSTSAEAPWLEIVGVVGDVRRTVNAGAWHDAPSLYQPASQIHPRNVHFVLRGRVGDAEALIREAEQVVWRIDPRQPVWDVETMELRYEKQVWREKTVTFLVLAFAVIALLLAAAGLYAVLAHSMRQRRHEMGLRMALGADARTISRLVIGEASRIVLRGWILGAALTLGLLGWLASVVPFFKAPSLESMLITAFVLGLFTLVSVWLPARRAASISPASALREE